MKNDNQKSKDAFSEHITSFLSGFMNPGFRNTMQCHLNICPHCQNYLMASIGKKGGISDKAKDALEKLHNLPGNPHTKGPHCNEAMEQYNDYSVGYYKTLSGDTAQHIQDCEHCKFTIKNIKKCEEILKHLAANKIRKTLSI